MIAKESGLGRESLYKALAPGAKPRFDTALKVMRAMGIKLHVEMINRFVILSLFMQSAFNSTCKTVPLGVVGASGSL